MILLKWANEGARQGTAPYPLSDHLQALIPPRGWTSLRPMETNKAVLRRTVEDGSGRNKAPYHGRLDHRPSVRHKSAMRVSLGPAVSLPTRKYAKSRGSRCSGPMFVKDEIPECDGRQFSLFGMLQWVLAQIFFGNESDRGRKRESCGE